MIVVGLSTLTLVPSNSTGTGSYVRGLLGEFASQELPVQVTVLANSLMADEMVRWSGGRVPVATVGAFSPRDSPRSRLAAVARATVAPGRIERELSPDLDLLHYPLTLPVPRVRLPTVVTLHDVQHHDLPQFFSWAQRRWRRFAYDDAARRAAVVITISEYSKSRIVDRLGIDPERVEVIHHGVDLERFSPAPAVTDAAALEGLALPPRFVLYPAALWPHKNHLRLVDAFARVDDSELSLVLTGPTFDALPRLHECAANAGVAECVRHVGFVSGEALAALYRRATALVFPSLYEGFGLPVLEAMASGCPVAASTAGPLPEICGDSAVAFDPTDIDAIADAVRRVTGDSVLRPRLVRGGREHASRFTWRRAAERHAGAYVRARGLGLRDAA